MSREGSGYYIDFKFKYDDNSKEEYFDYEIPNEFVDKALVRYFEDRDINLDGKTSDVFNTLSELGVIDTIMEDEDVQEYLREQLHDDAFEEFKDEYEFDHDLGQYAQND